MKQFKVVSLYFFLIVNLFSGLGVNAKSIVAADIVEGQQYVPNFLKQKGHFEKNSNGTSAYADAAGTRPVDGTGGAPTLTCTRTTSSPIDGDGSLLITKDAVNRQGEGCTIQFTIDSAYKAKVLQIEFDYLVASGTFTAGSSSADSDLIAYIYDVTNGTLIEPSSIKFLSNSTTIADHFVANFQTSATGTTYNLILHQATTSASAYTVKADNFQVKPSQYVYGTPISDWVSYTPTQLNTTNVNFNAAYWRRVGDSIEVTGRTTWNGAGAGGQWTVQLPSGLTFDTTKSGSSANDTTFGIFNYLDSGVNWRAGNVIYGSTTTVKFTADSGTDNLLGSGFTASDALNYKFSAPISGWSSSVQVSDGFDSRLIAARYSQSAGTQSFSNASEIVVGFENKSYDTVNAQSGSTTSWKWTCPSVGTYKVNTSIQFVSGSWNAGESILVSVYKNGSLWSSVTRNFATATYTGTFTAGGSATLTCNANDYINIVAYQDSGATLNLGTDVRYTWVEIEKLQSPTTISATAKTVFDASDASGTIISTGATGSLISFGTVVTNTHGNYSSGIFTAQEQGDYTVEGMIQFSANSTGYRGLKVLKNNTDYRYIGLNGTPSATNGCAVSGATNVSLNAGDTLKIYAEQNSGGNLALVASGLSNYIVISKKK